MYNLYYTQKQKSKIIGLWRDSETNKTYKDYIKTISIYDKITLDKRIKELFLNKEICIFYTVNNLLKPDIVKGIIQYRNKRIKLNNYKIVNCKKIKPSIVKNIIAQYGGCTIYKNKNKYKIEVFYNV